MLSDILTATQGGKFSGIKPRKFFKYYGKVSMALENEIDIVDLENLKSIFIKGFCLMGTYLINFYNGIENILKRISKN